MITLLSTKYDTIIYNTSQAFEESLAQLCRPGFDRNLLSTLTECAKSGLIQTIYLLTPHGHYCCNFLTFVFFF